MWKELMNRRFDLLLHYAAHFVPGVRWLLTLSFLCLGDVSANGQPIPDGLTLWLRADAGVVMETAYPGLVAGWVDQSGSGHTAAQDMALHRPFFADAALNGLPVVWFDGNDDFLYVDGPVLTSQQFTIIAVVNDTRDRTDNSFREVISNWTFATTIFSVFFGTVNGHPVGARLTDDFDDGPGGLGPINDQARHFIFTGVSGATDAVVYQNTNLLAAKGSPLSPRDLSSAYVVGKQGEGNFEFWHGDIAELLVYDRELSYDELQQDWQYLQLKWNLY